MATLALVIDPFHRLVDTCYVLSFAVIILNTSLHNPSVKEKPTLDKFIAMNRGINDGKDLPRDILEVSFLFLFPVLLFSP